MADTPEGHAAVAADRGAARGGWGNDEVVSSGSVDPLVSDAFACRYGPHTSSVRQKQQPNTHFSKPSTATNRCPIPAVAYPTEPVAVTINHSHNDKN